MYFKITLTLPFNVNCSEHTEEMSASKQTKTDKFLSRGMSFQPTAMYNDDDENFEGGEDEDDEEDFEFEPIKKTSKKFDNRKGDEEDNETETESDHDDENDDVEGAYDPREFEHLNVDPDVSKLFLYIQKFQSQSIILDYKLKPFIPDFIPAVGDIDAFLAVAPPETSEDLNVANIGLAVLAEPKAAQSDPSVLDLQLRAVSKQVGGKVAARAKKVEGGEAAARELEQWIRDISDLHRSHYNLTTGET